MSLENIDNKEGVLWELMKESLKIDCLIITVWYDVSINKSWSYKINAEIIDLHVLLYKQCFPQLTLAINVSV